MSRYDLNAPLATIEISKCFDNTDPNLVWVKAIDTIRLIYPHYDFTLVEKVYKDVQRIFYGEFPGYAPIKTLYHDLSHTLEVFMCGVRLMHGMHRSGILLTEEEITLMLLAILMHDIGYAQRCGEEVGTGAQLTRTHVKRGVNFMEHYFGERRLPSEILVDVKAMILGTEHFHPFAQIDFANERSRLLAQIVATADIVGQMADRKYVEKLAFLFLEFQEAEFGNYRSMYDLMCQTPHFYQLTREKLDGVLGGIYCHMDRHFEAVFGMRCNYYVEAIENNMAYLRSVVVRGEADLLKSLKRYGIARSYSLLQAAA
ncbi:MAG: HD domain-containing protein [Sideroxydans sp.]|jgi:hypothetical protein